MYSEDGDRAAESAEPEGTWILQGEAAARTGFSVSAIRKWRRMGLVAERKISMGGDLPRVEVKLEDVLARAAMQPQRRPLAATADGVAASAPAGCLVIAIADLEELFERMVRAERRAERAEADLQAMEIQTRYTLGRLAELRRQLGAQAGEPGGPLVDAPAAGDTLRTRSAGAPRRGGDRLAEGDDGDDGELVPPSWISRASAPTAPVPPAGTRTRTGSGTGTGWSAVRRVPGPVIGEAPRPTPVPPRVRPAAAVLDEAPSTEVERLVARLRAIYGRLDAYRALPAMSPAQEAQRQRELEEYDRALLATCAALDIDTGIPPGAAVEVDARARLTRTLSRVGVDVREPAEQPSTRPRPRRPPPRPRP